MVNLTKQLTNIVSVVVNENTVKDEFIYESINHVLHCKPFKVFQTSLKYISQQEEVTAADFICVHNWQIQQ